MNDFLPIGFGCAVDGCGNEGRYLTINKLIYCGIHDALRKIPSVKISDLPQLIALVTVMLQRGPYASTSDTYPVLSKIKELVCHSGA